MENATGAEQLLILERLAWSDTAATAAEVTALQIFPRICFQAKRCGLASRFPWYVDRLVYRLAKFNPTLTERLATPPRSAE